MMYPRLTQARPNQPTGAGGYNNLEPSSPGSCSAAKTKQSHSEKKPTTKYSPFICYWPPPGPEYWIRQTPSPKPFSSEVQVTLWATQKGRQREPRGEKWVPQGIWSQRQVWFPGWNASWLKRFKSTSLEHTRHMLPFALRRSPCLRAGNRQWSENMARHWTNAQSLKARPHPAILLQGQTLKISQRGD